MIALRPVKAGPELISKVFRDSNPKLLFPMVISRLGQALSADLAARYTGNFNRAENWMIGFGMPGRAELAFVVQDIA